MGCRLSAKHCQSLWALNTIGSLLSVFGVCVECVLSHVNIYHTALLRNFNEQRSRAINATGAQRREGRQRYGAERQCLMFWLWDTMSGFHCFPVEIMLIVSYCTCVCVCVFPSFAVCKLMFRLEAVIRVCVCVGVCAQCSVHTHQGDRATLKRSLNTLCAGQATWGVREGNLSYNSHYCRSHTHTHTHRNTHTGPDLWLEPGVGNSCLGFPKKQTSFFFFQHLFQSVFYRPQADFKHTDLKSCSSETPGFLKIQRKTKITYWCISSLSEQSLLFSYRMIGNKFDTDLFFYISDNEVTGFWLISHDCSFFYTKFFLSWLRLLKLHV